MRRYMLEAAGLGLAGLVRDDRDNDFVARALPRCFCRFRFVGGTV